MEHAFSPPFPGSSLQLLTPTPSYHYSRVWGRYRSRYVKFSCISPVSTITPQVLFLQNTIALRLKTTVPVGCISLDGPVPHLKKEQRDLYFLDLQMCLVVLSINAYPQSTCQVSEHGCTYIDQTSSIWTRKFDHLSTRLSVTCGAPAAQALIDLASRVSRPPFSHNSPIKTPRSKGQ